ncbi:MAG: hypothetical protein AABW93_02255 [Nanoarchaeota archaeon]
MEKKGKKGDLLFWLFGVFFIILGILAFINAFLNLESAIPLWFSYIAVFLIGIGIITKNSDLIAIQANILFIPYIFWNIDFFYQLATSRPLWGITDYFFIKGWMNSLGNFITLEHIYIVPVSIGFIYLLGAHRKDLWKISLLEIATIFFMTFFLSSSEMNANCVFSSCISFISLESPGYQILWFFTVFIMIFLTNHLLVYLMKKADRFDMKPDE